MEKRMGFAKQEMGGLWAKDPNQVWLKRTYCLNTSFLTWFERIKSAQTLKPHVVNKLAEFVEAENEEFVLDDRTAPKIKEKKKPKALKLKEKAERRRKLMREVLEEQKKEENNNRLQGTEEEDSLEKTGSGQFEPVDSIEIAKKAFKLSKKQRKAKKAKKLYILRIVYYSYMM